MRYLLALVILMFGLGNPAYAKWPTTIWTVLEDTWLGTRQPNDERELYAQKYKDILEHASIWFQSMSFNAPYQINDKKRLNFKGDERYLAYLKTDASDIGSGHSSSGIMRLSTHTGFLKPEVPVDRLFAAAAVHELFHGIQKANPEYYKYVISKPPGPQQCDIEEAGGDWVTEGTASAVQIQYLERMHGYTYGHGFNGSQRMTWARFFDQPLDDGRLPPQIHYPVMSATQHLSWQCAYGTWYFWYAVGNMLGSKDPGDWRRTAYLRYIFEQKGGWQGTGLAMVDSGLKLAAQELDAIRPYHGGLFALYPQFVAQYLDVDRFYEKVEAVTLSTSSLYEATSLKMGDPIAPLATRAWRFRIQLPRNTTPMPYTVRFVLESPGRDSLDDGLHLIVDSKVIDRPDDPTAQYSHTRRTDQDAPNNQGELEYFVRIANVERDAAATQPREFVLRVEVEGFYGEKPTELSNDAIVGELPPGFEINGPGKYWTCSGGDDARASFTVITPDGHADQLERMLPQSLKNIESDFDNVELQAHAKGSDADLKRIQQQRKKFESSMQSMVQDSGVNDNVAQAAIDIRQKNETYILAKLYGTNADGACHVMFNVTLPGRQPAAQKITARQFSIMITPEETADKLTVIRDFVGTLDYSKFDPENMTEEGVQRLMQQLQPLTEGPLAGLDEPDAGWTACSFNERGCNVGELTLEHAKHDHLSGTFKFRVSRTNREDERVQYGDVAGFINITSAQTQGDNSLVDFMSRGRQVGDPFYIPGIEKLLQGGSMLGE